MLEAARRASCVGNVNNTRAIVIWKEQASPELIKAITPPLGYQQMHTAPCFILWYHDKNAYEINKWIQDLHNLADTRRIGTDVAETKADIDRLLQPIFGASWQMMAVAPLAFMDVGLGVCQALLTAYDEGLGVLPDEQPAPRAGRDPAQAPGQRRTRALSWPSATRRSPGRLAARRSRHRSTPCSTRWSTASRSSRTRQSLRS